MIKDRSGDQRAGGFRLTFPGQSMGQHHIRAGEPDAGGQLQLQTARTQALAGGFRQNRNFSQNRPQRAPMQPAAPKTADQLFEEKLKAFMSESDSKLSSMRADHRTKSRRR